MTAGLAVQATIAGTGTAPLGPRTGLIALPATPPRHWLSAAPCSPSATRDGVGQGGCPGLVRGAGRCPTGAAMCVRQADGAGVSRQYCDQVGAAYIRVGTTYWSLVGVWPRMPRA